MSLTSAEASTALSCSKRRRGAREGSKVYVIVLAVSNTDDSQFSPVIDRVESYSLKSSEQNRILEAIRAAACSAPRGMISIVGKVCREFHDSINSAIGLPLANQSITVREKDVLEQIAAGRSNREIADMLNITEGTVKNHVAALLSKLHLRNRTELAIKALGLRR
ncbi:MAG TPA: response regulator transcription factor [Methylocystis sp.]|nr:response regulator transcription factor [Methylocystis sp.]